MDSKALETPVCTLGACYSDYLIEALLARGGVAEVYRARHAIMQRQVAFKVISAQARSRPDLVARMEAEARALAEIDHPNIVRVHDAGRDPEVGLYIVMELLCGTSLRTLMFRSGQIPVGDALQIASAIADASHALHELGIYHRDIKPENIIVEPQRGELRLKLLDLGAAKIPKYRQKNTDLGHSFGTVKYMSPEHLSGQKASAASDQYALGLILYEMLAGHHPIMGSGVEPADAEYCTWHLNTKPAPLSALLPTVSEPLWHVIERALAKRPLERFESMQVFARALAGALHTHQGAAASVSPESAEWLAAARSCAPAHRLDGTLDMSQELLALMGDADLPPLQEPSEQSRLARFTTTEPLPPLERKVAITERILPAAAPPPQKDLPAAAPPPQKDLPAAAPHPPKDPSALSRAPEGKFRLPPRLWALIPLAMLGGAVAAWALRRCG